jgi:hypothetical protein
MNPPTAADEVTAPPQFNRGYGNFGVAVYTFGGFIKWIDVIHLEY